ncbi:hypothetical protein DER46DRAFT_581050 [Fusarium sp. MPI-SDFR-AT-0072]|nr:hypothetical protein DER46DRAFT_581050 [Fusarium sp. MPI-SDFR-AT-0072]
MSPREVICNCLHQRPVHAFLFLFTITNFFTLILNAATAGLYRDKQWEYFKSLLELGVYSEEYFFPDAFDSVVTIFEPSKFMKDSVRPYLLLAVVAGITWAIASIALLFLFTKIRHFNHRVARYVFRVIGVATFVFLVICYLTWAHTYNFDFPFALDWPLGKAAVIMAHIHLLLGIFITLLAAVLDTPKDWADHAPTGPNSRRTSQV